MSLSRRNFIKLLSRIAVLPIILKTKAAKAYFPTLAFWKNPVASVTPMQMTQLSARIVAIGGPGIMRTTQFTAKVVAVGGPGTMRTTQLTARVVVRP